MLELLPWKLPRSCRASQLHGLCRRLLCKHLVSFGVYELRCGPVPNRHRRPDVFELCSGLVLGGHWCARLVALYRVRRGDIFRKWRVRVHAVRGRPFRRESKIVVMYELRRGPLLQRCGLPVLELRGGHFPS